jgi:hypothetical protein
MKMTFSFFLPVFSLLFCGGAFAQVGVNTEAPKATLHILPANTDSSTPEGIIAPNLTRAQLISKDNQFYGNQRGAIVYVTDLSGTTSTKTNLVAAIGYYYFDGTVWQPFSKVQGPWNKIGTLNASGDNMDDIYLRGKAVIGTTTIATVNGGNAALTVVGADASINGLTVGRGAGRNNQFNVVVGSNSLTSNVTGQYNLALGVNALTANSTGGWNTAIGYETLKSSTIGNYNLAIGAEALSLNISGTANVAIGAKTLSSNVSGNHNAAIGLSALQSNTLGVRGVAVGTDALASNTIGNYNTGLGFSALRSNIDGNSNAGMGMEALYYNKNGSDNTGIGTQSLFAVEGSSNTAVGSRALQASMSGNFNTALGYKASGEMLDGNYNVAVGANSGVKRDGFMASSNTVAIGYLSEVKYDQSIAIGSEAQATAANAMAIGARSSNTVTNSIVLGNNAITSIRSNVQSITALSDRRVKKDIRSNVPGLAFINKLNPVTYHLDMDAQAKITGLSDSLRSKEAEKAQENILQTGFIAQEVEQAAQESNYDFNGIYTPKNDKDTYGLNYSSFVVPLVKAVQEQQAIIETLLKRIEVLEEKLK